MTNLINEHKLELNGNEYKLDINLKVAHAISRQYGGFIGTYQALGAMNLEVACFIIRTGTDGRGPDGRKMSTEAMETEVWRHGVAKLTGELIKFVNLVESGGAVAEEEVDSPAPVNAGNE